SALSVCCLSCKLHFLSQHHSHVDLFSFPTRRSSDLAVGSFAFINAWNNFLFALMFLNVQDRFTVPVGLSYMLGEFSVDFGALAADRKSTRLNSSHVSTSYAVFCLQKKKLSYVCSTEE